MAYPPVPGPGTSLKLPIMQSASHNPTLNDRPESSQQLFNERQRLRRMHVEHGCGVLKLQPQHSTYMFVDPDRKVFSYTLGREYRVMR